MEIINEFPGRLKALRMEEGISQVELAAKLGRSKQVICNYENDKRMPDLQAVLDIANHFDVSIDYLFGKTDYKHPGSAEFKKKSGLNDKAIKIIQNLPEYYKEILNAFINASGFDWLLHCMNMYIKQLFPSVVSEADKIRGKDTNELLLWQSEKALGNILEKLQTESTAQKEGAKNGNNSKEGK